MLIFERKYGGERIECWRLDEGADEEGVCALRTTVWSLEPGTGAGKPGQARERTRRSVYQWTTAVSSHSPTPPASLASMTSNQMSRGILMGMGISDSAEPVLSARTSRSAKSRKTPSGSCGHYRRGLVVLAVKAILPTSRPRFHPSLPLVCARNACYMNRIRHISLRRLSIMGIPAGGEGP